jgi:inhibitor of cysteine peptidase
MGLGGLTLVVVVCAAALLTACGGSGGATIKVTEGDNDKTVAAKVGDELSVTLKENPTTGYEWTMIAGPGLSAVSDAFTGPESSPSPLMGAGGTHTWVYTVDQAGTLTLTGVYARSWESKSAADFSLTVDATE